MSAAPQLFVVYLDILRGMLLLLPLFLIMVTGSLTWAALSIPVALWPMTQPERNPGEPVPAIVAGTMLGLIIKDMLRQLFFFMLVDGWLVLKLYSVLALCLGTLIFIFQLTGITSWTPTRRLCFEYYNH